MYEIVQTLLDSLDTQEEINYKGFISGLNMVCQNPGEGTVVKLFHNGTKLSEEKLIVTNGGRVVTVTVLAPSAALARLEATRRAKLVQFTNAEIRKDIGLKADTMPLMKQPEAVAKAKAKR